MIHKGDLTGISAKIESKRTLTVKVMRTRILSQVLVCVAAVHLELLAVAAEGTKIKDSESASHGTEDAFHQIVDTHRFPGFVDVSTKTGTLLGARCPAGFRSRWRVVIGAISKME